MLKLKVTYYLTPEGLKYFPQWYAEVLEEAAQQPGFRGITQEEIGDTFVVYLYFENEPMLDLWRDKDTHEALVEKIIPYFAQPPEVQEKLQISPDLETKRGQIGNIEDTFRDFKNIGKAVLGDLKVLGISSVQQLADADPDELYTRLQALTGTKQDPCMWDVFMAIIHEASFGIQQSWWVWTPIRKKRQAAGMFC